MTKESWADDSGAGPDDDDSRAAAAALFKKKKSGSGGPPLGNPGGITESNPASPVDDRFYLALACSGLDFCSLAPAPHARLSILHVKSSP